MADGSERAAKARVGESAAPGPDWETLPEAALVNILQRVSLHCVPAGDGSYGVGATSCAHFLTCKRWWALARECQLRFEPRDSDTDRTSLIVRGIQQFPNLTDVDLRGRNISDSVLETLASCCPKVRRLTLQQSILLEGPDALEELPDLEDHGLGSALEALTELQFLHLGIPYFIPDTISSLQKLEELEVLDAIGEIPEALLSLPSLKKLTVMEFPGTDGAAVTGLTQVVGQLTGLESLKLDLFRGSLDAAAFNEMLSHLCNLQELKLGLHCMPLRSLPPSLFALPKLRILDLDAMFMRTLPRCLGGGSEEGQTLRLEEFTLYSFRGELVGLPSLSSTLLRLCISNFDHILPYQLGSLCRLQHLKLHACKAVQYFPETVYDLASLQELRMESCERLEALPRELRRFPQLKVLSVKECPRLKTLPEDVGDLPALRELRLKDLASLTHLPQSLANARALTVLRVDLCPRAILFPGLLQLPSLDYPSRRALEQAMQ